MNPDAKTFEMAADEGGGQPRVGTQWFVPSAIE